MKTRIHKILADHGIGSRRGLETLIRQRKVFVNGQLASIGQLVTENDIFEVDGRSIKLSKKDPKKKRVLMYNKKVGEISSRKDPDHKRTIFDTLPKLKSPTLTITICMGLLLNSYSNLTNDLGVGLFSSITLISSPAIFAK